MPFRLAVFALGLLLSTTTVWAGEVFIGVGDTTAGQDQMLQIAGLQTGESIGVTLRKPTGAQIELALVADNLGKVQDRLYGLHLRDAGQYELAVHRTELGDLNQKATFMVHPGTISAYRSSVNMTDRAAAADGQAVIDFAINLRDAYSNPVPNESVQLISSRNEDSVVSGLISDAYGVVRGSLKSQKPGVSVFSVLANDIVLVERPEVIWHPSADKLFAVGQSDGAGIGSFLKAQLFDDDFFQEAAYFTIEDLPGEVLKGRNYTFRVEAKDQDGNTVKDYDGRVRFSASDAQAQLPVDYQFEAVDQGIHTFALAVNFATTGSQTLSLTDLDNSQVVGSLEVEVVDSSHDHWSSASKHVAQDRRWSDGVN